MLSKLTVGVAVVGGSVAGVALGPSTPQVPQRGGSGGGGGGTPMGGDGPGPGPNVSVQHQGPGSASVTVRNTGANRTVRSGSSAWSRARRPGFASAR
jgi:hypothetical protein